MLHFSSEPQVICAPPEFNPDLSSMFKGSDNPLSTIFQGKNIEALLYMFVVSRRPSKLYNYTGLR